MPSSSASVIARIPASGVRRSCETHETSSRREASSRASRSRDSSSRSLVRASSAESDWNSAGPRCPASNDPCVAEPPGVPAQCLRPARDRHPERGGHQEGHDAGRDRHPHDHAAVVVGDEHHPRDGHDPASTEPIATPTTTASCQKNDERRITQATARPMTPTPSAQAAGHEQDLELVGGHDAASQR